MIKEIMAITTCIMVIFNGFVFKTNPPATVEQMAEHCSLSVEDFELFAGVVEAESNRQAPTTSDMTSLTTDGRIYIALTIWNRAYNDDIFASVSDPRSVVCQSGQFSTVSGGVSCTQPTDYSRYAVVYAYDWINGGAEYPEVLFFNCRYFFSGREPYPNPNGGNTIGGNYFSL